MIPQKEINEKDTLSPVPSQTASEPDLENEFAATVDIGAATHQGLVRENNEDHYLVVRFQRALAPLLSNVPEGILEKSYDITGYGMLIADGMGGMAAGEVASRMALAKVVQLVVDTPDWILSLSQTKDLQAVLERMTERFLQVDAALRDTAKNDFTLRGMGTTLTVAAMLADDLILGHIGDSRVYLWRNGNMTQLTNDHTLAQSLINAGVAKPDDPAARSMRHVLTAAMGSLGEQIEPQVRRIRVAPGDQILLCTDGLTDMVDDAAITAAIGDAPSAQHGCQDLVDLALAGGGRDNVTVVLARLNPVSP
ncbi:MAG: hypothetical protein C5B55_01425 [Blastocatellia bacterium]|nr:MAG: hypothetical protein C5B55_01425 [Blastocatellia bacterium]